MPPFESRLRVRYAETDAMGVVYHANLLVYFEIGRTELLRAVGPPYRDLEASGTRLAVVGASLAYRTPFRYDDPVLVRTRISELGKASVSFAYELLHGDTGALHAAGDSRHASVDLEGKVRALPPELRALLAPHV